jgi:hypothetical protein
MIESHMRAPIWIALRLVQRSDAYRFDGHEGAKFLHLFQGPKWNQLVGSQPIRFGVMLVFHSASGSDAFSFLSGRGAR